MVTEFILSALMVLMVTFVFLMKQGTQTTLSKCSSNRCTTTGKQMIMTNCDQGCLRFARLSYASTYELQDCLPLCEVNSFQVTNTTPCTGPPLCTEGNDAYTVTSTCKIADGIGFTSCTFGQTETQQIPCVRSNQLPNCGMLILPGGISCSDYDPFFISTTDPMDAAEYGLLITYNYAATCSTSACASMTCDKSVHALGKPTHLGPVNVHSHLFGVPFNLKLVANQYLMAHADGSLTTPNQPVPPSPSGADFVITNYQTPTGNSLTGQMVAYNVSPRVTYSFTMSSTEDLYIAGWSAAFVME